MANFVSKMFNSGEEFEAFLEALAVSKGLSLTYSNGNIYLKNEKQTVLGTVRLSELLETAITEEADRAKAAESENATAINNEATRALAAEQANAKAINDEVTRAKAAESENATAINNLETWKEGVSNGTTTVPKATSASLMDAGVKKYTPTKGVVSNISLTDNKAYAISYYSDVFCETVILIVVSGESRFRSSISVKKQNNYYTYVTYDKYEKTLTVKDEHADPYNCGALYIREL